MSDWIQIDADHVKTEPVRGPSDVEINVFLSPYDVPEAVRGYYDEQRERFVIEFRYMSDEPTRAQDMGGPLVLHVGKRSGRLHEIEVDVNALKAQSVTLNTFVPERIGDAIDALATQSGGRRLDNYNVAKEVLRERRDQLFQDLARV